MAIDLSEIGGVPETTTVEPPSPDFSKLGGELESPDFSKIGGELETPDVTQSTGRSLRPVIAPQFYDSTKMWKQEDSGNFIRPDNAVIARLTPGRSTTEGGKPVSIASAQATLNELRDVISEIPQNVVAGITTPFANMKAENVFEAARAFNKSSLVGVPQDTQELLNPKPDYAQMRKDKRAIMGVGDSLANFSNFFSSPLGMSTLGIGALPAAIQRSIAIAFAVYSAKQVPELATALGDELGKPTDQRNYEKIGQITTDLFAQTGFAALSGAVGAKPGIAKDIPALRDALTAKVKTDLSPDKLKAVFNRVDRGAGTPDDVELVKFINEQIESPGQAIRKGVTITETKPKISSQKIIDYLGLEKPTKTAAVTGAEAAQDVNPQRLDLRLTQGEPNAANPIIEPPVVSEKLSRTDAERQAEQGAGTRDQLPGAAGQPEEVAPAAQAARPLVPLKPGEEAPVAPTRVQSLVVGKDFSTIQKPHRLGVEAGLNLTDADVPEIKALQTQSNAEMMAALAGKDDAAFKSAFGKSTFLGGLIEGAERKGPNYDAYQAELKALGKPQPKGGVPQHGEEVQKAEGQKEDVLTTTGAGVTAPEAKSEQKPVGSFVTQSKDSFGAWRDETVEVLSIGEPTKLARPTSDGGWRVEFESPSTLGKTGRQTRAKFFFKKRDALKWIDEVKRLKPAPKPSGASLRIRFSVKESNGQVYVADQVYPRVQMGKSAKDTKANRTRLQNIADGLNSGKIPLPAGMQLPTAPTLPIESVTQVAPGVTQVVISPTAEVEVEEPPAKKPETKPATAPPAPPKKPTTTSAPAEEQKVKSPLANVSEADRTRAAEIKAEILRKLTTELQMNMGGFDPKIFSLAGELATIYVKGGAKTFNQFAKAVKEEMPTVWERIKRYLRGAWNSIAEALGLKEVSVDDANVVFSELDKPAEKPVEKPAETPAAKSPSMAVADWVKDKLTSGEVFTGRDLFAQADIAFGGTMGEAKYTPKDAYDAMELGVNSYLSNSFADPRLNEQQARAVVERLKKLGEKLPTQTKRTAEMDEFQQFSTPPPLAYVISWVANISPNDVVLEPNAGIGGIAVFGKNAGAKVIVNELSPRRAELLKQMGFDQVFTENGEQLNNILPADVKPTVVVTNPPFSATAGRMQGARKTVFATQHLEQDLARLEPGGRLVAIVGEGMAADKATFKTWWRGIQSRYNVRANIGISGKEYAKYGTSFDNQIVVIDKPGPTDVVGVKQPLTGNVQKIEELIPLLEGIRNERKPTTRILEQPGVEPTREEAAPIGETETRPVAPAPVPTGGVGARPAIATGGKPTAPQKPGGRSLRPTTGKAAGISTGSRPGAAEGEGRAGERPVEVARPAGGGESGVASAKPARQPENTVLGQDLTVTAAEDAVAKDLEVGSVFENYTPQITIKGALPHPTPLSESSAMSSVKYPVPDYKPSLPSTVLTTGALSAPQFEAVMLAGAAHARTLPDGRTRGFFVGDGTGVGKGRTNAAILFDNWNKGKKRGVWFTADQKLFADAQRDIDGIGWNKEILFLHKKTKPKEPLEAKQGILFSAYSLLRNEARMKQIVDWLGKDFDGVIVFDESHKMANAVETKGARGKKAVAGQALAGIDLQTKFPKAKIVYVSATGATEVSNLAYAERLGIWGEGTPFANREAFISEIGSKGVGAMEIVAKDLKSMGLYVSRNLSFDGVTYEQLEHTLTDKQRQMYDMLAGAWQMVLGHMDEALVITEADKSGQAKSAARSAFWGAHQRFFNQILTSLQMPTVIEAIKKNQANGDATVLQLVNTNESQMERAISKATEGEESPDLETLDITPRETLIQYVENAFPVDQFEEYTDENGVVRSRPVLDSQGNRVKNAEAVAMREALINKLASVRVPVGALDEILETFGEANVAEVTGRTRRVVTKDTPEGRKKVIENRTAGSNLADRTAFNEDKKTILVFSDAGGTGASYHADKNFVNQRPRKHLVLQPGWRADNAIQGLGRSHRSNQKQPPHFVLASTDVPGHKRFISTIARRIEQLGALTKGQRQTTSQGIFNARDNLESSYAKESLRAFLRALAAGRIEGLDVNEFAAQTGLKMFNEDGQFIGEQIQIGQFLNRLLSLNLDMQEKVFKAFSDQLDGTIEWHKTNGTLDVGMETLAANSTKLAQEQMLYTDPETQAQTKLIKLDLTHPTRLVTWSDDWLKQRGVEFIVNKRGGTIWKLDEVRTRAKSDGSEEQYRLALNVRSHREYMKVHDIDEEKFDTVEGAKAKELWDAAYANAPKNYVQRVNLVTGTILPVWDRIPGINRIARAQEDSGQRHLGVLMHSDYLPELEKNFGLEGKIELTPEQSVNEVLDNNATLVLANGWRISKRYVSGENRIEISGPDYSHQQELERNGVIMERIQYSMRYFIPTGDNAADIMGKIIKHRPIVEVQKRQRGGETQQAKGQTVQQPIAQADAEAAVSSVLGLVPSNVTFVTDVNAPKAQVTMTPGKPASIVLNLAKLDSPTAVVDALREELIHAVWDSPEIEGARKTIEDLVTEVDRKRQAEEGYNPDETQEEAANERARRIFEDSEKANIFVRAWRAIVEAIKRVFGIQFSDAETARESARTIMHEAMKNEPSTRAGTKGAEPVDETEGDVVEIQGIKHPVISKDRLTPNQVAAGNERARDYFEKELNIPGIVDPDNGRNSMVFEIVGDGTNHDEAGKELREHLIEQIPMQMSPGGDAPYVTSLVNIINANFNAGNLRDVFSKLVMEDLMNVSAGESSRRGTMLRAINGIRDDINALAQNADLRLKWFYADAFDPDAIGKKVVEEAARNFRDYFTDEEIAAALKDHPEFADLMERLRMLKRADAGGKVYRRAQALLKPKREKKLVQLQSDAKVTEAVEQILSNLKQKGIEPKPSPNKKLTPLKSLLLLIDPNNAGVIDEMISHAIAQAERNAGVKATLKELSGDELKAEADHFNEKDEDGVFLYSPEPEMVEEGLTWPEYQHWAVLRDNLLGYDPITLKLAHDYIRSEFKGVRFGEKAEPKANTKIDIQKLAVSPDEEVKRVLDAHFDNLKSLMDATSANEETKQRVYGMVVDEVTKQLEARRKEIRERALKRATIGKVKSTEEKLEELVNSGIFKDPALDLSPLVNKLAGKSALQGLLPKVSELIKLVFETPVARQAELGERFAEMLVSRLGIDEAQAKRAGDVFMRAFDVKLKDAQEKALVKATDALTPKERKLYGKGTPLWKKLRNMVNAGGFDTGALYEQIAKGQNWNIPSQAELDQMRAWSDKEYELRQPTQKEIDKFGSNVEARLAVEAATEEERKLLLRKMQAQWSRWTLPVIKTWRDIWDARKRFNSAMAVNEWMAGNFLAKFGFGSRQTIDVGFQMVLHTPTRAVDYALKQWDNDKSAGRDSNLLHNVSQSMSDAYRVRIKVLGDALVSFRRTLMGRGEQKNVEQLITALQLFDRLLLKADKMKEEGKPAAARFLTMLTLAVRFGRQFAAAADVIQGVPAEAQEIAHQVRTALREQGKSPAEINLRYESIMGLITTYRAEAMSLARQMLEARGLETGKGAVERAAWHILREKIYFLTKQAGLQEDDWREQNAHYRNVIGWNESEYGGKKGVGGPGGVLSLVGQKGREWLAGGGIPAFPFMFANAMGISLNRKLAWTPLGYWTSFFKGSPWWEGEENIRQRKVEATIGTAIGALVFILFALGKWVMLPLIWPKDEKEKAKWVSKGWSPGMVIIPWGEGEEIHLSSKVGPMNYFAPYAAAGAAYARALEDQKKRQDAADAKAAKLGLAAEKVGMDNSKLLAVATSAALASVVGGRTASGAIGTYTDFSNFSPKKTIGSSISSLVPFAPAYQELSRASGVNIDPKLASVWDLVVPLPTSGARRVNLLGDPLRDENDVRRIFQVLSGGSYPIPSGTAESTDAAAYAALFSTDFRPPSINPDRGYAIGGQYRPLNEAELSQYTQLRGQYLKQELAGLGENADKKAASQAYQRANNQALREVGVDVETSTARTQAGRVASSAAAPATLTGGGYSGGGSGVRGAGIGVYRSGGRSLRRRGAGIGRSRGIGGARIGARAPSLKLGRSFKPRSRVGRRPRIGVTAGRSLRLRSVRA